MELLANTSHVVLPILYTVLVIAYAQIFARGPRGMALIARKLLVVTVGVHLASILLLSAIRRACPLGSGAEFLSLMAFSITLIYLLVELRSGVKDLGIFAITPAFVLEIIATVGMLSDNGPPPDIKLGLQASIHSFAAIVGFASVALANVYGLLYLILYTAIKRGNFGLFYRKMPSLEKLSDLNMEGVGTAFIALSVNVAVGLWEYFGTAETTIPLTQPVVLLTLLVWILYGICLVARRWFQLSGKRAAIATLLGVPFLLAIFVGEFITNGGFHN